MEQTECSETSTHKIQTTGNHPSWRIQQMEQTACSETSTHKIQTPGKHPREIIQQMEQTECRETSVNKIPTPGNHPREIIQHSEHSGSLKSGTTWNVLKVMFVVTVNVDVEGNSLTFVSNLSLTGCLRQSFRRNWHLLSKPAISQLLMEHGISLPCARHHYTSRHWKPDTLFHNTFILILFSYLWPVLPRRLNPSCVLIKVLYASTVPIMNSAVLSPHSPWFWETNLTKIAKCRFLLCSFCVRLFLLRHNVLLFITYVFAWL